MQISLYQLNVCMSLEGRSEADTIFPRTFGLFCHWEREVFPASRQYPSLTSWVVRSNRAGAVVAADARSRLSEPWIAALGCAFASRFCQSQR